MQNVGIEGIGDLNVVTNMFYSLGCVEADNCILVVTNRDFIGGTDMGDLSTGNAARVGAKAGGIAGGLVAGAVASAVNNAVQEQVAAFNSTLDARQKIAFNTDTYSGFLLNVLSTGVGVIPLRNSGQIVPRVKDLITDVERFFFFRYDEMEYMQLKKLPLNFVSMKLAICFKGTGELKVDTPWELPKKHKLLPYQEENFKKLEARL